MAICEIVSSNLPCEIVPKEEEMPHGPKKISVKYTRKTNHAIQVEHVLGGLSRSH